MKPVVLDFAHVLTIQSRTAFCSPNIQSGTCLFFLSFFLPLFPAVYYVFYSRSYADKLQQAVMWKNSWSMFCEIYQDLFGHWRRVAAHE